MKTLTPEKLAGGSSSKVFPRRVRLSDGAMGVVVTIGVAISKSRSGFCALTQGNVWKSQYSEELSTLIALMLVVSAFCQLSAGEARV